MYVEWIFIVLLFNFLKRLFIRFVLLSLFKWLIIFSLSLIKNKFVFLNVFGHTLKFIVNGNRKRNKFNLKIKSKFVWCLDLCCNSPSKIMIQFWPFKVENVSSVETTDIYLSKSGLFWGKKQTINFIENESPRIFQAARIRSGQNPTYKQ